MVIKPEIHSPIYLNDTSNSLFQASGAGKDLTQGGINLHVLDNGKIQRAERFSPRIRTEDDLERIKAPQIYINSDKTENEYQRLGEIFGDILQVKKGGISSIRFGPLDDLVRLWGVNEFFEDLYMRPELVHKAMGKMLDVNIQRLNQYEKLNILSLNNNLAGCMAGGMGETFTDELPGPSYDHLHVKPCNMWGNAEAQIFSCVSPEMHEEFALHYEKKWLERFGLVTYGCCEQLHEKVDILSKIPNLRKISMSCWIDVDRAVEKMGNKYVFSYKPNPAIFAAKDWNLDLARDEIVNVLEKAKRHNCQVEIIMRTILTFRGMPERLKEWTKMAMETVQSYS